MSTLATVRRRWTLDWVLVGLVSLLLGIGVVNLYSAAVVDERSHHINQLQWIAIGAVVAGVVSRFDYRFLERYAWVFYGGVVGLLVLVPIVGTDLNTTAQRWLDLGFFNLQPSEPMKVATILITARYFAERERPEGYGWRDVLPLLGVMAVPCLLVLSQPDLGTSLTIGFIFATIFIFERVRAYVLLTLGAAAVVSMPLAWLFVLRDYQKARILSFLNPGDSLQGDAWQVSQSRIAIGSGRLNGKGYLQGTQVQNGFVPEHENDFVFAHHGEQFGFLGSVLLLALYFALVLWCLNIARHGRDRFAVLTAVGIAAFFFWHVVINIGMVTGMLPVVGLWLPLASYGGSAMLSVMTLVGILLSISSRRQVF